MSNYVSKEVKCYYCGGIGRIRDNISLLDIECASSFKDYLILDDDTDMLYNQRNNFVRITNDYGLTDSYIQICLNILSK